MGISREQALDCFRSNDLIGIGMEADAVRRRLHPEGVVSYAMLGVVGVGDDLVPAIAAAEEMGATGVVLTGAAGLQGLEVALAAVKRRFPEVWVQGLSAAEVLDLAEGAALPLQDALARLRDAGLDSIGGIEPEVPGETWLRVHRAAHELGMQTTARIVFGAGESYEQRLDGLESIVALQAEAGGFAAIAPVSFHAIGGRELDETTAVEYLKTLAVVRMFVDNVENVESDWTTQGLKVLQMGLRFGGNDVGAIWVEHTKGATEEELRRVIRDAGFQPAQRDLGYRAMMVG